MATLSDVVGKMGDVDGEISEEERNELNRISMFMIENFGEEVHNLTLSVMLVVLASEGKNIDTVLMSTCFTSMYIYRKWLIENGVDVSVAENKFTETKTEE